MSDEKIHPEKLKMVTTIVSAYVSKNKLSADQLPELIRTVHGALEDGQRVPLARKKPAVPIRKSVNPDYIVCLEDGRKLKMLKRHLRKAFDMSPADYRTKWGLPEDYPMVAPKYAAKRSELARKIGLGRGRKARPRKTEAAGG